MIHFEAHKAKTIKNGGMGGDERGDHYEVGGGENRLQTYCFDEVKG